MKIATWNVNSLKVRLPHVLDWLAAAEPDVLCLQETKLTDENFPREDLEAAGYQVVPYTINDRPRMDALLSLGVDGIISDAPDILLQAVEEYDADGNGVPGDYIDANGLIDPALFDAQGHRGARGLLPENTLPAFRRALELGVSTLELDLGVTRDRQVVVSHDRGIDPKVCAHADGTPVTAPALLRDLTLAEVQAFDCGRLNPDRKRFPEPPRENLPGARIPSPFS